MKITKATVNRINAHSNPLKPDSFIPAISTIGEILHQNGFLFGDGTHYDINDGDEYVTPTVLSDGSREFISGTVRDEYRRRVLSGLQTRFQSWISCTFTHGLNGVNIYEVNKLVKAILDD